MKIAFIFFMTKHNKLMHNDDDDSDLKHFITINHYLYDKNIPFWCDWCQFLSLIRAIADYRGGVGVACARLGKNWGQ